ncbi:hypothetical protein ELQ35_08580 [Peribacillus cavernae]|uniref:SipL SPOCS domain-containing protein n=1 Tax=Peribacillus cavernae TaxID=1674310 RepID=A0A3S1B8A4_9BACI|nr:hypothetical protein [Peribacillus cavernae]MDQ0217140.1 hypothetical protein [Peribacillus cavernae]RUQ30384.1 hypothetical protein ELQ35_08580 [Peribacillus cavernae]
MENHHDHNHDCPKCEERLPGKCPPKLTSDCFVVNSLVCSREVQKVAELTIPAVTLGDIVVIGPGGVITPLITLQPDLSGLVSNVLLVRGKIINTGYLPANIVIAGVATPLQINLPFQQETECPGACPEDTVTETPFQIEAIVVQGIEALGISVASVRFKVVLRTSITVTRPVIAKLPNIELVQDANSNRCNGSDVGTMNTSSIFTA